MPDALSDVVAALRAGGHVIFVRHAATDTSLAAGGDHHDSCAQQRNLDRQGRADATALGATLRTLRVPVSEVRASPYCRTADTARLAFGVVRLDDRLLPAGAGPGSQRHREEMRRLLFVPPAGGNRVLVGHSSTLAEILDVHLEEGEAAVIRTGAGSGARLVGRLPAGAWLSAGG